AAGQDYASAPGAGPAGRLELDVGAAADHDDGLPGQFRLAPAGRGGHDSSWIRLSSAGAGPTGRSRGILAAVRAGERAVPPPGTNSPMTAARAQGAAMTIIAGWCPSASAGRCCA